MINLQMSLRNNSSAPLSILLIAIFLVFYVSSAQADINLVKVDKSARKMYLVDHGHIVRVFHIALGANPKGPKQQEGDEKTPEGIYQLDYKKEDSSFYRAMHINYPNEQDKENARKKGVSPGGFIMVHGQQNWLGKPASITRRFDWTEGCIALSNHEMDEFMRLVKVGTEIRIEW